jgi:methylase of polypeptide subunit release factors
MSWAPIPDRAAARTVGDALRRVGYSEDAVIDLLGEDGYGITSDDVPVGDRRLPDTRLGTVVRALFLQLPVPTPELAHALGRAVVDALAATGVAAVGDEVVLHGRIVPVGELFVASDDFPGADAELDPQDFVAAYTPTSKLCDALTPRGPVDRALDIGTGSGVQAMLSARHAREVVATDVNERALAFAELNAALNGFTNIDCRLGSLFEPVAGETFDVITSNAPFVVSPENRWAYRDGGLEADQFSELIVTEAAKHLSEHGFATLLVSWVADDEDETEARPLDWVEDSGCDSWICPIYALDPLDHAVRWNVHLAGKPEPFGQVLDTWQAYLENLGVEIVTEGAVLLHRRAGDDNTARVDVIDDDVVDHAGNQIKRAFEARARLAELHRPSDLLDERVSLAGQITLEREIDADGDRPVEAGDRVQMTEGMNLGIEAPKNTIAVVGSLTGEQTLGDVVDAAAERLGLSETDAKRLRRESLDLVRELLELGALRFRRP